MKPIEITTFVQPKEGMKALEGWLVQISQIRQGIGMERLLAKSNDGIYEGIIVPYEGNGVLVMEGGIIEDMIKPGIYIHGVPVILRKEANLWTSELAGKGSFLTSFEGEAIALLDAQDRWYVPWMVLFPSLRRKKLGEDSLSFPSD